MTIATEITRLQTAKADFKTAFEALGVTIPPELKIDAYPAKFSEIQTGGSGGEWTKPADWIDISEVADNEINLLVTEGSGFAFTCTVAESGTFSVDWGDGTIDHNCTSGAVQQHIHTVNGTPWTATGGHTWKVRVYNATAAITTWKIARHTYTKRRQYSPLLWAVVGAQGLTDCSFMFCNIVGQAARCFSLQAAYIASFNSCTTASYMFSNCYSLSSIQLPTSWGLITNVESMFTSCYSLYNLTIPSSWGSITTIYSLFANCYCLTSIQLPTSWGLITNASSLFSACSSLTSIQLPTSWGLITNVQSIFFSCQSLSNIQLPTSWGSITNIQSMFEGCYSLSKITLPSSTSAIISLNYLFYNCYTLSELNGFQYLGSTTSQIAFTDILRDCENLQSPIVCSSLLSKFGANGAAGYVLKIPSIRLTNPGSTFTGSSPQINVSYTSLDATALENLFTDLPTLTGKTINITGCVGAASLTPTQREIATNKGWTIVG